MSTDLEDVQRRAERLDLRLVGTDGTYSLSNPTDGTLIVSGLTLEAAFEYLDRFEPADVEEAMANLRQTLADLDEFKREHDALRALGVELSPPDDRDKGTVH